MNPPETPAGAAARLIHQNRLALDSLRSDDGSVWIVRGDAAVYRVIVAGDGRSACPCPAAGICAHRLAAGTAHRAGTEPAP